MTVFADSSAVVKLYSFEPGHEEVHKIESMYVSQIARVEVPAALWRKKRMGELERRDCLTLIRAFEADYFSPDGRLVPVMVESTDFDRAAELVALRGLRAYDGVQLAGALKVAAYDATCRTFATFDVKLRRAAEQEGFDSLPTA